MRLPTRYAPRDTANGSAGPDDPPLLLEQPTYPRATTGPITSQPRRMVQPDTAARAPTLLAHPGDGLDHARVQVARQLVPSGAQAHEARGHPPRLERAGQ